MLLLLLHWLAGPAGRPARRPGLLPPLAPCLQASRVLACLVPAERVGTSREQPAPAVMTVWQLLAVLAPPQLKALTACPTFYDLVHTDVPEGPLPAAALSAMLEVSILRGVWWRGGVSASGQRAQLPMQRRGTHAPLPPHALPNRPPTAASGRGLLQPVVSRGAR